MMGETNEIQDQEVGEIQNNSLSNTTRTGEVVGEEETPEASSERSGSFLFAYK